MRLENTDELCGFTVAPLTLRTQTPDGKRVPKYAHRTDVPWETYVIASFYPKTLELWQDEFGNVRPGFNLLDCVSISESSSGKLNHITSTIFENNGSYTGKKIACVDAGDTTFYRRQNKGVSAQYYNTFKSRKHVTQLITMSSIEVNHAVEVSRRGTGNGCESAVRSKRFFKSGTSSRYEELIDFMNNIGEKGDYVPLGFRTKIVLNFFYPILGATCLGILIVLLRPITKKWYRVSDPVWEMRLLINHYENLESCAEPKEKRWVGITNIDGSTQHLGVASKSSVVARDYNKGLRGSQSNEI